MYKELKISGTPCTAGKAVSAACMILLLLFLTSINFFLYPSSAADTATVLLVEEPGSNGESQQGFPSNPAGPDEKSPDAPVTINEEYVHHNESGLSPFLINMLFEHKIHEAEKLCVFHFELLSPPPEI